MKNIFILIFLILPSFTIAQQGDSLKHKNEVGIDITGLLQRFFNLNNANQDLETIYQLNYKRHYKNFSLRAGLGGNFNTYFVESNVEADDDRLKQSKAQIDTRLGMERRSNLSKRFIFYYGLDLLYRFKVYDRDGLSYRSFIYRIGKRETSRAFGAAPFLGFEFKINNRIAILTEASFAMIYTSIRSREYSTTIMDTPNNLSLQLDDLTESEFINEFNYPDFLILNFKF